MDCTFGITRYGYSLCTLIALNERGRGVPVCVAIVKRERDVDFANLLQTLRNKLGHDWRPSIFLADAAKSEHNGIWYVSLLLSQVLTSDVIPCGLFNFMRFCAGERQGLNSKLTNRKVNTYACRKAFA
jgi:hypothetical protein